MSLALAVSYKALLVVVALVIWALLAGGLPVRERVLCRNFGGSAVQEPCGAFQP